MKIKAQTYGEILYKLLAKNEDRKTDRLLYGFLCLLEANGDLGQIENIIKAFDEYYKKEEGLRTAVATVARQIDGELRKTLLDYVKKIRPSAKKVELIEKIDPTVLGGVKIMVADMMFDCTLQRQVINLKNTLIQ